MHNLTKCYLHIRNIQINPWAQNRSHGITQSNLVTWPLTSGHFQYTAENGLL
jgi:hypothetical protein